jgi:tetratricopeptide (TPR) repeat protein
MKKIILVSLSVFVLMIIVITLIKNKPATGEINTGNSSYSADEKERVLKFWSLYREATDYRMNDQWEHAAERYRQALDINGQHEDALYYLGNMYLELSQYKEAEECWLKLTQINPQKSRAYLQLGTLYLGSGELFDIDKAEMACRKALNNNKEETGPVLLLGEVNLIRGQLDEAAKDFQAVMNTNFKSAEACFLAGYIEWKKGDFTKARDLFSRAVEISKPTDNNPQKVVGEGDTKKKKVFGDVISKSVFRKFMTELPTVSPDQLNQALEKDYKSLNAFLVELKSRTN